MEEEKRSCTYDEYMLDPRRVKLTRASRGSLIMQLSDAQYHDLDIRRAFPLENDDAFIGFFLPDGTELGLLEDLKQLDPDSRRVLEEELEKIYFRPRITRFDKLIEEHGMLRGQIETTSGPRQIEIRGWRENVRVLSGNRTIVEDVDGNRFLVDDWRTLTKMTREILGL